MKTLIKSSVYAMLTVTLLSVAVVFTAPTKKAHASLLWDVAGATYVYRNRKTLTEMYHKAKDKGHVYGVPKIKVIKRGKTKDELGVVTKKRTVHLGWYGKYYVKTFKKYWVQIKHMFTTLYHNGRNKWNAYESKH